MKYHKFLILSILLVLIPIKILDPSVERTRNESIDVSNPVSAGRVKLNETNIPQIPYITGSGTAQDPYRIQDQENLSIYIDHSDFFLIFSNCTFSSLDVDNSKNIVVESNKFSSILKIMYSSNINITNNDFKKSLLDFNDEAIIVYNSSGIGMIGNSIYNYTTGIYILESLKILFKSNQITWMERGVMISSSDNCQICENDIGESKETRNDHFYLFPKTRQTKSYQYQAIGIWVYNTSNIDIYNNTIHNIFGNAIISNDEILSQWIEDNVFLHNLRITEKEPLIYDLLGIIFDLYLALGLVACSGLGIIIYKDLQIQSQSFNCNSFLYGFIILYLILGFFSRRLLGTMFLIEELGILFILQFRKSNKKQKISADKKRNLAKLALAMNIFTNLVTVFFVVEQVQLYSRFAIRWDADFLWDWVFVVSTNVLWFLIQRSFRAEQSQGIEPKESQEEKNE